MEGKDWEMGFLGLMGWKRKWVCGFLKEEPLIEGVGECENLGFVNMAVAIPDQRRRERERE